MKNINGEVNSSFTIDAIKIYKYKKDRPQLKRLPHLPAPQ